MEEEPNVNISESNETNEVKPITQELKVIAHDLGFIDTPEIKAIRLQAVEHLNEAMIDLQTLGEEITKKVDDSQFGLARVGLMITRASILYESGNLDDCVNELYDALTDLDILAVTTNPEATEIIQKIETVIPTIEKGILE